MSNVVAFETDEQAHNRRMAEALQRWADMAASGDMEGFAIAVLKEDGGASIEHRLVGCQVKLLGAVECLKTDLVLSMVEDDE